MQLDSLKEFYNSLDSIALIDNKIDNSKDRLKNYVDSFNNYVQTLEIEKSKKFKSKEIDNLLNSSLESIKNLPKIGLKILKIYYRELNLEMNLRAILLLLFLVK